MPSFVTSMFATAVAIADRAVVADIECEGIRTDDAATGCTWLDISSMVNEQEHAPACIDMNREALAWAFARELIQQHPTRRHLVRVVPRSAATPSRAPH